ncbi:MAG: ribosomal protein L7/L12 [Anaerolineae bacterium]
MALVDLLVLAVVVFVLVFFFARLSRRGQNQTPREPVIPDWVAMRDPDLQAALANNKKIEAIKRYRELTGQGLKEARDAIDYALAHPEAASTKKKQSSYDAQDAGIRDLVEAGKIDEAVDVYRKFAGVDEYTARDAVTEIERQVRLGEAPPTVNKAELLRLAREGNMILAVKMYREATGTGLKEALDAVEALKRENN